MRIARTRDRDEPADIFEAFVRDNIADVWRFVRRRVDATADADDLTAEVFATAWRRRDESPLADERRLWLFGVARLVLRNHHRAGIRRERLHLRLAGESAVSAPVSEPPADDAVWQALASLGPDDRDLLIMRAWDGLPVNDIAVVLGIGANAVSQRLATARRRLGDALNRLDRLERDGIDVPGFLHQDRDAAGRAVTDRPGTGHDVFDPATETSAHPPVAPRHTKENGDA